MNRSRGSLRAVRLSPGAVLVASLACQAPPPPAGEPHVVGSDELAAGRYLAILGGCNDCHTDGYLQSEGNVPEAQWLAGSPVGWRGPWGTTYARNLRLAAQTWTEDQWVETLRTRRALPPMPWSNVNRIAESDARILYRYIRSLGPLGEQTPDPVAPDQEPSTPYVSLVPTMPGGGP